MMKEVDIKQWVNAANWWREQTTKIGPGANVSTRRSHQMDAGLSDRHLRAYESRWVCAKATYDKMLAENMIEMRQVKEG